VEVVWALIFGAVCLLGPYASSRCCTKCPLMVMEKGRPNPLSHQRTSSCYPAKTVALRCTSSSMTSGSKSPLAPPPRTGATVLRQGTVGHGLDRRMSRLGLGDRTAQPRPRLPPSLPPTAHPESLQPPPPVDAGVPTATAPAKPR